MSRLDHEQFMRLAIETAQTGIAAGQTPFGAVVVRDGQVCSATHNSVWRDCDPTAHAEVNAIRVAAKSIRQIDFHGCVMYTTCEPCPMCLSAIHWAKFDTVYYGALIADAISAGFAELCFDAKELARQGKSPLKVELGPLREECADLFRQWREAGRSKAY